MQAKNVAQLFGIRGDNLPPQNVDAEEAVLGGLLIDPVAIERVIDVITPEAFYNDAHGQIFRAVVDLHEQGKAIDLISVFGWLRDRNLLEKAGGQKKLGDLVEFTVSAVNIDQYAELIQEKYLRRRLLMANSEIAQMAHDTNLSIEIILDRSEQKIFQVGQQTAGDGLLLTAESIPKTFADIERRSDGDIPPGIACGFYDLDAMTQGFQRSDLIIVAGRPSMGKTAFVLNVAKNIASFHGLPVAVFSLEMSVEQLNYRLLSSVARIEVGRLRAGRLVGDEWDRLATATAEIAEAPLGVDDSPLLTVNMIRARSRRFAAQHGGALGAVIIDYLQLMEGGNSGDNGNRVQELSRITRALKQLARELDCPVIALSQLSRGVESRTNKRPMMSDLRESGSIEQDADLILMLYRDEYYNPDTPDRGIAEVVITKHRNGPVGTVKLLFQNAYSQFMNLASSGGTQSYPPMSTPRKDNVTRIVDHRSATKSVPDFDFQVGDRVQLTAENFDAEERKMVIRELGESFNEVGTVIDSRLQSLPGLSPLEIYEIELDNGSTCEYGSAYLRKVGS